LGTCWPISTSGDLFLTKSAVPDATVMFVLRDSDPFVVQCSFGALKRPFFGVFGLGGLVRDALVIDSLVCEDGVSFC
jgi:hypothetical protein